MRIKPKYLLTQIAESSQEIWVGTSLKTAIEEFLKNKVYKNNSYAAVSDNDIFCLILEKVYEMKYDTIYEFVMECEYDFTNGKFDMASFTFNNKSICKIKTIAKKENYIELLNVFQKNNSYTVI